MASQTLRCSGEMLRRTRKNLAFGGTSVLHGLIERIARILGAGNLHIGAYHGLVSVLAWLVTPSYT